MRSNIFTLVKAKPVPGSMKAIGLCDPPVVRSVSLSGPGLTAQTVSFPSVRAAVHHLAGSPRLLSSGRGQFTFREVA